MFCPKCGAYNEDSAKFCAACGEMIGGGQQSYQPPYQDYQLPQQDYQMPFQGAGAYKAPISARNALTCIILSIVTCGIYGIIWYIGLVDDLNKASQSQNEQSGVTVFLLTLLTCGIYGFIWAYKAGEKVNMVKQLNGERADSNISIIYLVLNLFGLGIVTYYLIQTELNKVASN